MKQHIPEKFSTRLIDWSPFVIMGNTVPPQDPDEDEEDENDDDEDEDNVDQPPVVREPDEDLSRIQPNRSNPVKWPKDHASPDIRSASPLVQKDVTDINRLI
jgi:hypothetical protein